MGPREDDGKGEIGPGFFVRGIPPSVHKQRQTFSPLPSTDFVQNMAPTFCFKSVVSRTIGNRKLLGLFFEKKKFC